VPRIFDNLEHSLLPALKENLTVSIRADFCVGYFNLRSTQLPTQSLELMVADAFFDIFD
jgi:hypothetical protein